MKSPVVDRTSEHHDYRDREERFREDLKALIDRELATVRIHIVFPEINIVYFGFSDGIVSIQGDIGGEVLRIVAVDAMPNKAKDEFSVTRDWVEAALFTRRKIVQARVIGEAWNGHGLELGFEGLATQTLIISSVECQENDSRVADALRIGRCTYTMEIPP